MVNHLVEIPLDNLVLEGDLVIPDRSQGIVLFAHGSGSSRHSPRNQYVARMLSRAGLSTLLLDLLTPNEESTDSLTRHLRFDIPLLGHRLTAAIDWLAKNPKTANMRMGLFGASTGAAASLVAAAARPSRVNAIVSRSGRPDLVRATLPKVNAPTLLIVGGYDDQVIRLNRQALDNLKTIKILEIVPGASHLFEEAGSLNHVATLARDWFSRFLTTRG